MNSWMQAHDSLQAARRAIDLALTRTPPTEHHRFGWKLDYEMLRVSTPFSWGHDSTQAVFAACDAVPDDTILSHWNLPVIAAWWHFERPLPVMANLSSDEIPCYTRALCLEWIDDRFIVSSWTDWTDGRSTREILPAQVWCWNRGETLKEMNHRITLEHTAMYGPGGEFEHAPQMGGESFLGAANTLSRFILAGLAWMSQKLLVQTDGPIERHVRKDHVRRTGQTPPAVKVIQLRKIEHAKGEASGEKKVDWQCRWLVGGHWRNQVCGPKRGDHRLTYILPYLKGPDDKPLKAPVQHVYEVNR